MLLKPKQTIYCEQPGQQYFPPAQYQGMNYPMQYSQTTPTAPHGAYSPNRNVFPLFVPVDRLTADGAFQGSDIQQKITIQTRARNKNASFKVRRTGSRIHTILCLILGAQITVVIFIFIYLVNCWG